tara:strand:- start:195 stop:953 length:759 start_codon:yes stop_codon:yes gene_type:complete
MLSDTGTLEFSTVLRSNEFSDAFKGLTFYIGKKSENNELQNIFIKDVGGNLNTLVNKENEKKKNSTILAKKGFIVGEKLILFNGIIQGLNLKNEIKNIEFEKTELTLKNISTRTIKQPKIQETSSVSLINCVLDKDSNLNFNNCSRNNKLEAIQTLSRRIGMPLYIPLISIITSFLLIYKKEKKYNFLDKYYLFFLTFVILVFAEILLKFTGFSFFVTTSYFALPVTISFIFYIYLVRKMKNEKIMRVIIKK